jgi:hypothetical protein
MRDGRTPGSWGSVVVVVGGREQGVDLLGGRRRAQLLGLRRVEQDLRELREQGDVPAAGRGDADADRDDSLPASVPCGIATPSPTNVETVFSRWIMAST